MVWIKSCSEIRIYISHFLIKTDILLCKDGTETIICADFLFVFVIRLKQRATVELGLWGHIPCPTPSPPPPPKKRERNRRCEIESFG